MAIVSVHGYPAMARACAIALLAGLLFGNAHAAAPPAPGRIEVARNRISADRVRIFWDDVEGAQRYAVYRLDGDGAFAYLGKTYGNSFSCRDAGPDAAYIVRAIDADMRESETLTAATLGGTRWVNVSVGELTRATGDVAAAATPDDGRGSTLERRTLAAIDERRARYGKPAYEWDESAYTVAQQRAKEMRQHNDFSHTAYEYGSVLDTYSALVGKRPKSSGECIFASSRPLDAEAIVEAWMNSPGHRDILLDNEGYGFEKAAIATGQYEEGTSFGYSGWYYAVLIVHR